eukprot:12558212-Ditylum_brightwellii.AAC.1
MRLHQDRNTCEKLDIRKSNVTMVTLVNKTSEEGFDRDGDGHYGDGHYSDGDDHVGDGLGGEHSHFTPCS